MKPVVVIPKPIIEVSSCCQAPTLWGRWRESGEDDGVEPRYGRSKKISTGHEQGGLGSFSLLKSDDILMSISCH